MPSPFIISSIILSILLILLQFIQSDLLFLRENIQQGELWRIWTGNLIHSNYYHLTLNLAGFWVFVLLFKDLMKVIPFLLSLTLLISGVGLGLYFLNPELYWYAGLSGALYGLFIIGGIYALIDKDFITGLSILIIIPAKIMWDHTHNAGQHNADLIGVPVSTDSHLYGITTAFLVGVFILLKHLHCTHSK